MDICEVLHRQKYDHWADLEAEIEKIDITVEKGNAFEQFCFFFLSYNKEFYQIAEIYSDKISGREIPADGKKGIDESASGIEGRGWLSENHTFWCAIRNSAGQWKN